MIDWIDPTDEMPPDGEPILIWHKLFKAMLGKYIVKGNRWHQYGRLGRLRREYILYWAAINRPEKESVKDE